jgi:hypothetical protein
MGNMISIIGGAAAIILGIIGLIAWNSSFVTILKGTIPVFLLLGGAIALMAGMSEMKGFSKSKKE